jgi:hypothetical protein
MQSLASIWLQIQLQMELGCQRKFEVAKKQSTYPNIKKPQNMERKQRSAKIQTTLWHKLIRRKRYNDGEIPNPNSLQKKGNQRPRNYNLTVIYQYHFPGNRTWNWIKGYFLVFYSNRSLNQNQKNTCWKTPTKKLGPATPFFKELCGSDMANRKPLQIATSNKQTR